MGGLPSANSLRRMPDFPQTSQALRGLVLLGPLDERSGRIPGRRQRMDADLLARHDKRVRLVQPEHGCEGAGFS